MAKKKTGTTASRLAGWRWWIQAGFLFAWLDPFMLRMHTVCSPVFHCYSCPLATFACPIGVLANFSAIHLIPFAALGTLIVLGAVLGSFVCGWACPFGFLQDLAHRVPTRKFTLPSWTGYFRYVSLIVLVIAVPFFWARRIRCSSAAFVRPGLWKGPCQAWPRRQLRAMQLFGPLPQN